MVAAVLTAKAKERNFDCTVESGYRVCFEQIVRGVDLMIGDLLD